MRRGFTLIELLIVLAIIVIISAMAIPLIRKPLARNEIQKAANTVRTKLHRARIGAMRSNRVYTFQYNAGSGSYRLAPEDSASGQQQADAPKGGGEQGRSAEDDIRPEEGVLADGVCFQPDNSPDPDIVEAGAPDHGAAAAPQNAGSDNGWSDTIYFYPDGTTSDARFIVAGNKGLVIPMRIRGVTGNVVQGGIVNRS